MNLKKWRMHVLPRIRYALCNKIDKFKYYFGFLFQKHLFFKEITYFKVKINKHGIYVRKAILFDSIPTPSIIRLYNTVLAK